MACRNRVKGVRTDWHNWSRAVIIPTPFFEPYHLLLPFGPDYPTQAWIFYGILYNDVLVSA